ncbi:transglycosylase [Streptomyces fructofermentans]|uniref:Transglycosylase n=2 Tax=Streptomyces fructofermentans TaxID=152141 RepID=A0A918KRT4_9ACTN|nr:transglycosylase [Streptomyces fructofermentans]
MGILSWIILGLLAGAIAKVLLPGRDPGGFVGTTLIGVAGAFIGGWISSRWLDHPISKDFYDGATWVAAIGGSLVLLIAYRILFGHSRDRERAPPDGARQTEGAGTGGAHPCHA